MTKRLEDRKLGRLRLDELKRKKAHVIALHYACEPLLNASGLSPRVTTINLHYLDDGQTLTYSIFQAAQAKGYNPAQLSVQEVEICEKQLLGAFVKKVKQERKPEWVHWKMRSTTYGFQALAQRCEALKVKWHKIPDNSKHDLDEVLRLRYTDLFEHNLLHGTLVNLAKRNDLRHDDVLRGDNEGDAFKQGRLRDIDMSSQRKAELIARILGLAINDELKVKVSNLRTYGFNPPGFAAWLKGNWVLSLVWGIGISVLGIVVRLYAQNYFAASNQSPDVLLPGLISPDTSGHAIAPDTIVSKPVVR
jgi:hypothetical protein